MSSNGERIKRLEHRLTAGYGIDLAEYGGATSDRERIKRLARAMAGRSRWSCHRSSKPVANRMPWRT